MLYQARFPFELASLCGGVDVGVGSGSDSDGGALSLRLIRFYDGFDSHCTLTVLPLSFTLALSLSLAISFLHCIPFSLPLFYCLPLYLQYVSLYFLQYLLLHLPLYFPLYLSLYPWPSFSYLPLFPFLPFFTSPSSFSIFSFALSPLSIAFCACA